jgi:hypothetical protein
MTEDYCMGDATSQPNLPLDKLALNEEGSHPAPLG